MFARDVRRWAESSLGSLEPLPESHPLAVGRFAGGFDLTQGIRFTLPARRRLRAEAVDAKRHHLEAVMVDGRPAVIFSRFGLTGPVTGAREFGAAAYRPASARKVLSNILGYVLEDGRQG